MTDGARKDDPFARLGGRQAVPRLSPSCDFTRLALDELDGFVLSRVDGRTAIGEICLLAPFPEAQTIAIVTALFARGVLDIAGVPRPPTPPPQPPPQRQPAAAPPQRQPAAPPQRSSAATSPPPPPPPPPRPMSTAAPASPLGAALVDGVDLPPEVRARVDELLAIAARGDDATLLGVAPGDDKKAIRRAYFKRSKEFHPDRYFKRELGPYKQKLQSLFAALTDAAERLGGA